MRKLLNTLFVTTPDSYLSLDGNNVVLLKNNNVLFQVPVCNLESIICFNYLGASPKLMNYCTENNIHISFMTPEGRYLAGITGKIKGNVLLRKKQYLLSENIDFSLNISKRIITAKLYNSRVEINRTIRDNQDRIKIIDLENASIQLKNSISELMKCNSFDELRGIVGDCARLYFSVFNDMINSKRMPFILMEEAKDHL